MITKSALVIEKNALCLSQSAFSNFAPYVMRLAINGACYCLGKGTPERLEHYTRNMCNAKCEIMGATLLMYYTRKVIADK